MLRRHHSIHHTTLTLTLARIGLASWMALPGYSWISEVGAHHGPPWRAPTRAVSKPSSRERSTVNWSVESYCKGP